MEKTEKNVLRESRINSENAESRRLWTTFIYREGYGQHLSISTHTHKNQDSTCS